ncbi:MAG: glycoside hydrolase family 97 N-terminal domain-containing protein, partial [Mangrovibacterium sp.]
MKLFYTLLLSCVLAFPLPAQQLSLNSPDGRLKVKIELNNQILFSVCHEQTEVLAASPLSMKLADGTVWGAVPRLKNRKFSSVDRLVDSPVYKKKVIREVYQELVLNFRGNYSLTVRAYDQGVAYRFSSAEKNELVVAEEQVELNFSEDYPAVVPYVRDFDPLHFEQQFFNSFENTYAHLKLSELNPERLMFLPLIVELQEGKKLCVTEADLEDYPGLYLINRNGSTSLTGVFAPYPKKVSQGGHNMLQGLVTEREDFIAKSQGPRNFPWRVFAVSADDRELLDNDLVYLLASPSRVEDASWVKPGKVAWD